MHRFLPLLLLAVLAVAVEPAPASAPHPDQLLSAPNASAAAFFRTQVWPILRDRCLRCHEAGNDHGDLRLDSLAAMLKGGEEGPALVPGDAKASPLVQALLWHEHGVKMPPKTKLPQAEIDALTRWVDLGAPWPAVLEPQPGAVPAAPPPAPRPPYAGRLHPALVHIPIAALLLALVAELLVLARGEAWRRATWLLLAAGAAGAALAVASGTLLEGEQDPELLKPHELLGWLTLGTAIGCLVFAALRERRPWAAWPLRLMLLAAAVFSGLAGHLGGQMVYGRNWL